MTRSCDIYPGHSTAGRNMTGHSVQHMTRPDFVMNPCRSMRDHAPSSSFIPSVMACDGTMILNTLVNADHPQKTRAGGEATVRVLSRRSSQVRSTRRARTSTPNIRARFDPEEHTAQPTREADFPSPGVGTTPAVTDHQNTTRTCPLANQASSLTRDNSEGGGCQARTLID